MKWGQIEISSVSGIIFSKHNYDHRMVTGINIENHDSHWMSSYNQFIIFQITVVYTDNYNIYQQSLLFITF